MKNLNPKISLITISYNSKKHIEDTILSVTTQNYDNYEYIIIDGASTDGTLDILNKYQDKITTIITEPDKGISDAFNKGIRLCTGDIIGIINSDDILLPGALSVVAKNYDEKTDIYRGNEIIWNDISNAKFREKPSMTFPKRPFSIHVTHESSFITQKAYHKFGIYDTTLHYIMDLDLLTRMFQQGAEFKYINCDLVMFRLGGTTSDSFTKKRKEYMHFLIKNGSNKFQAELYWTYLVCFDKIKQLLDIIDPDLKKKIRLKRA